MMGDEYFTTGYTTWHAPCGNTYGGPASAALKVAIEAHLQKCKKCQKEIESVQQ